MFLRNVIGVAKITLPTGSLIDDALNFIAAWNGLGYLPHISAPRTFNEFIQSSKRRFLGDVELARRVTDKLQFKDWLEEKGYGDLVVPTLGVYENVDNINDLMFDRNTILKPTHLSGPVIPIRESRCLTADELKTVKKWTKIDYYRRSREKTYVGLRKRLMCETLLLDSAGNIPMDFKFFTCSGNPFMVQVDMDRFGEHTQQYYSVDWTLLDFAQKYPRNPDPITKPGNLDAAIDVASDLSRDFTLCRVDLYMLPCGVIKAGEITFFPHGGAERFSPASADFELGRKIKALLDIR